MQKRYLYTDSKGGVTKTTNTLMNGNIAQIIGKRTALVEMDWQGNLAYACGYDPEQLEHTIYTLMMGKSTLEQTLLPTYYDPKTGIFFDPKNTRMMQLLGVRSLQEARRGPDLLPNNTELSKDAERDLQDNGIWGLLLRNILDDLEESYEEIHIDTNPSIIHKFTKIGFYACTDVVIPVIAENWALQGMITLSRHLMSARELNPRLNIAGIMFSRVKYASHKEMMAYTRTNLVNDINTMFENTRKSSEKMRRQLQGLTMSCFECTVREAAEFSRETNKRANVLLANGGITPLALEYWLFYLELIHKTQGSGLSTALSHYNALVERYQRAEKARAQPKTTSANNAQKGLPS